MAAEDELKLGTPILVVKYPFDASKHFETDNDYKMVGAHGVIIEVPNAARRRYEEYILYGVQVVTTCGRTVKDFVYADEVKVLHELELLALEAPCRNS